MILEGYHNVDVYVLEICVRKSKIQSSGRLTFDFDLLALLARPCPFGAVFLITAQCNVVSFACCSSEAPAGIILSAYVLDVRCELGCVVEIPELACRAVPRFLPKGES